MLSKWFQKGLVMNGSKHILYWDYFAGKQMT